MNESREDGNYTIEEQHPTIYDRNSASGADIRPRVESEEIGWLIELPGTPPLWWSLNIGPDYEPPRAPMWSGNAYQGLRFSRKQDAEDYIAHLRMKGAIATEHIWHKTTEPPPPDEPESAA